jgi:hypothetical protein
MSIFTDSDKGIEPKRRGRLGQKSNNFKGGENII